MVKKPNLKKNIKKRSIISFPWENLQRVFSLELPPSYKKGPTWKIIENQYFVDLFIAKYVVKYKRQLVKDNSVKCHLYREFFFS